MEERRKSKRLELEVTIQIERLDKEDTTTLKYVKVGVTDISKTGIGFIAKEPLEVESFYDCKLQIWTKEVIDSVIEIVRVNRNADGSYNYGARFIGMTETDALKIEIYQLFNEL
ncbi:MAG: PilZ domain-containing protein [Lachnospiraceae bacterium]|nr:PilZ domain-containing protein [Lachnospiraceae bacterium]